MEAAEISNASEAILNAPGGGQLDVPGAAVPFVPQAVPARWPIPGAPPPAPPLPHPVDQPFYPGVDVAKGRGKPEKGTWGTKPVVDDGSVAPGMQSALARLEHLEDPCFEALHLANESFASLACTREWAHLQDTFDVEEWIPLLSSCGADHGNLQSLVLLAQCGVAGRVEANRLVWTWCHPQASNKAAYWNKPQVFQAAIRNARKSLDQPPRDHQDWQAWVPGHALGPYWEPSEKFIPTWANGKQYAGGVAPGMVTAEDHASLVQKAVAEATAGMMTMAEVEEAKKEAIKETMDALEVRKCLSHWRPWYVLSAMHENRQWSLGWWYDEKSAGEWLWWDGTTSVRGRGPWTN